MSSRKRTNWLVSLLPLLALTSAARADFVQLGTRHFTDGQLITGDEYSAAVAGQPAPFDDFIGSDLAENFSASFSFNFGPQAISAATFTLGIYDADSAADGDQVGAFSINGIDQTALLNAAFNGHGGTQREYNVFTITLPSTVLVTLAGGQANVSLSLVEPGLGGGPGNGSLITLFNGAGLDFSTLTYTPTITAAVPEPSSLALVTLAGISVCLAMARRRRRVG